MVPDVFVTKWRAVTANERAVAQSHFNDLAALLDVANPLDEDPEGKEYAFERRVNKAARGKGFADVWKRGAFAWEYKGKGKDLGDAYRQLLLYRDDLENPPLLIVSDIDRIEVHTNFTGTTKAVHVYTLDDLLDAGKRAELRQVWTNPGAFDPRARRERITEEAASEIGLIALSLRDRGHDSEAVAHFVLQLVFALFAEDTGLLPNNLVSKILARAQNPERVESYLTQLFQAMSTGGEVLLEDVPRFNGGLFDGQPALPLTAEEIMLLHRAAKLDWAEVEPAIFGTLFERSLDPAKRSQLGAHYTSRVDILRIVEPVVMRPLRVRWDEIRAMAEEFLAAEPPANARTAARKRNEMVDGPIASFLHDLHQIKVLDPACGSGNFLYVALQTMKDLEHEVVTFTEQVGSPGLRLLGPRQFYGIEVNPFARELASTVVWIGYLQWNRANGISSLQDPVLEPLNNIVLHDALMNEDGSEFEWPEAEFVIGNPPFLGNYKMRTELGNEYTEALYSLFRGRIPNKSDLVCYWFEKARAHIDQDKARRAGLIATSSIRGGANRKVLERIKESGGIFYAWDDEPWILDGAAVRVSIVGFDDGTVQCKSLNGQVVSEINSDLTFGVDLRVAQVLPENRGISFEGVKPAGPFDVPESVAQAWLDLKNPGGSDNRDVLREFYQGKDVTDGPTGRWIVDFNDMTESAASAYVVPFAHVEEHVKPRRAKNRLRGIRENWWRFDRARPELREALTGLKRYLVAPRHMKHRAFVWVDSRVLPGDALTVIATEDDYVFGLLHSYAHRVWALRMGTTLEDRPRYTPTTCFEPYPFPNVTPAQRAAITQSANHLDTVRCQLLTSDDSLTLTELYNEISGLVGERDTTHRAFPALRAHELLDEVVAAAYGWEWPLDDEVILERLLELNLERSKSETLGAAEIIEEEMMEA